MRCLKFLNTSEIYFSLNKTTSYVCVTCDCVGMGGTFIVQPEGGELS